MKKKSTIDQPPERISGSMIFRKNSVRKGFQSLLTPADVFLKSCVYLFPLLVLVSCQKTEVVVDASDKNEILKVIEAESKLQSLNSVAFCVVKEDSLLWADAVGYANTATNKLATAETRYLIASISKSVTAVAAMQLYEQNLLNLDADINTYLPFSVVNPNHPDKIITTRMLLNHSSSIADGAGELDMYCWGEDCPTPLGVFVEDGLSADGQNYSPGTFYEYAPGAEGNYSNMGYALLGYIVERVANMPFDEYCKQNIFLPLGMNKTEWRIANTPLDEWAIPYSPTLTNASEYYSFPDYPDGGLKTTVVDLSKFMRMLIQKGTFNNQQILLPATVDLMETPMFTLIAGPFTLDYGLGLYQTDINGVRFVGHSGGELGASTNMYFNTTSNVGVIVFTNTSAANISLITNALYQYGNQ
jgi:CubicO group peptidase (beta-lactamase class C family)